MRHFGDSAQSYNSGAENLATDGRFAPPLSKHEKTGNLAQFIHDQFSPANQYDLAANVYGGGESARNQEREQKSLRSILPPLALRSDAPAARSEAIVAPAVKSDFSISKQEQTAVHPLLAHLRKAESPKPEATISMDFRNPLYKSNDLVTRNNDRADAFSADNCYQTISINPQDGTTKTITTLPDLSSTKIHTKNADGSSIAYTDGLGRTVSENRYNAEGKLMISTSTEFGNGEHSAIPSRKVIKTASETIEVTMDSTGTVLQRVAVPYSDLSRNA